MALCVVSEPFYLGNIFSESLGFLRLPGGLPPAAWWLGISYQNVEGEKLFKIGRSEGCRITKRFFCFFSLLELIKRWAGVGSIRLLNAVNLFCFAAESAIFVAA